jgi:hypothetical protein
MSDEKKLLHDQDSEQKPASGSGAFPLKPSGEVVVKHEDSPPPAGQRIHPRRPLPIVPTREERTGEDSEEDDSRKPPSR